MRLRRAGQGRGAGVGRGLGVGEHLPVQGVEDGVGVDVADGLGVRVGVGVDVAEGVGVGVGVAEGVGVGVDPAVGYCVTKNRVQYQEVPRKSYPDYKFVHFLSSCPQPSYQRQSEINRWHN